MGKLLIEESSLTNIGNAIRAKTGKTAKLSPSQMVTEIAAIETGGIYNPDPCYFGTNAKLIDYHTETWHLSDTTYTSGSTPPSSPTIKNSVSNYYVTPKLNFGDNDIVVFNKMYIKPTYNGSQTDIARQVATSISSVSVFSKERFNVNSPSSVSYRSNFFISTYGCLHCFNQSGSRMSNTSGLSATGFTSAFGSSPAIGSTSAATTTISFSAPPIYLYTSSYYMSQNNIKCVSECEFVWETEIYTCDKWSTPFKFMKEEMFDRVVN